MPKHNNKGRSTGEARHVRLYYWLLESAAWQSLDAVERALYILLVERYNGKNNGELTLSCREAARALKISKDTASRKFAGLVDRGFIAATERSGFNLKTNEGHTTRWRVTEFPTRTGKDKEKDFQVEGTKEFMRWRPPENSFRGQTTGTEAGTNEDGVSQDGDTTAQDTQNCPSMGTDSPPKGASTVPDIGRYIDNQCTEAQS